MHTRNTRQKKSNDIAILKEFEKITHSERRDYSRADVVKYIEFKWNRRIKNSKHNVLIPVQVKQVKISSIAMPMFCPLVMQKTIHKILLDRCIDLANFTYQYSLVPSPNCQCQKAEETSRHFLLGTGRFGKKHWRRFGNFSCRNVEYHLVLLLSWFWLWFSTNWLGPVCRIPVCRILELKKNYKTINVGMMESIKSASDMSPFPLVPRGPLGRIYSHLAKRGRTGAKT